MRKIYVAHPLRGSGPNNVSQISKNITTVDEICRTIRLEHPDVLILSPIHAFGFEAALTDQTWALGQCAELLTLADELWVFGDWETSEGCTMEVARAREMGLTIVYEDGRIEGGCCND